MSCAAPRTDRVAYVCAIAHVDERGRETSREARCEGRLATEPRGEGGFGYDPAFLPDDGPRRSHDGRAEQRREALDLPPRPRRAGARRGARGSEPMTSTKSGAAWLSVVSNCVLIVLKLAAGAAHRVDRDPDRGDPLGDRSRRLADRAVLGPQGRGARRRGPPLRAREGRERRRRRRGDADPARCGDHRHRGRSPSGQRLRGHRRRHRHRGHRRSRSSPTCSSRAICTGAPGRSSRRRSRAMPPTCAPMP